MPILPSGEDQPGIYSATFAPVTRDETSVVLDITLDCGADDFITIACDIQALRDLLLAIDALPLIADPRD